MDGGSGKRGEGDTEIDTCVCAEQGPTAQAPGHLRLPVRAHSSRDPNPLVFPLLSLSLLPELTPGLGHRLGPAPGQQARTPPAAMPVFPGLQSPQPLPTLLGARTCSLLNWVQSLMPLEATGS